MNGGLTDDEKGGFRAGRGCVDQIFTLKKIGEKKRRMYVGSIDLEKVYDRINRKALWQVLRIYDVSAKLLSGIKSIYVDSLVCVRVKGDESEWLKIDSGVRQGCIMFSWLFNVYIDAVMKRVKMGMGRKELTFLEEGRE